MGSTDPAEGRVDPDTARRDRPDDAAGRTDRTSDTDGRLSRTADTGGRISRAADAAAVLFDMDGVLVDSERYWHAFEEEFALTEAVAGGRVDREETTGMNFREIYDYLNREYGTTVSKATFVSRYQDRSTSLYGEEVVLLDGAPALFDALRERGTRLAIVSSAPPDWITTVRERFSLGPLDLALSAEDIDDPGKPEPHIYERAAAELGVTPGHCVVVEDSHNGVLSAVGAGCYTVGIRRDHNVDTDLSDADEVVESPAELRRALLGE